jgi:hypothetical protein
MPSSALRRALALLTPIALVLVACGDTSDDTAADPGPSVSFTKPADGAHVAGGVVVEMAAHGITIEPAGEVHPDAGHFHVIADDGCVNPGEAVPKDADHIHFGKAQTTGTIYLGPGKHTLCLQPGDGAHVALDPTDKITVDVGVHNQDEWCSVAKQVDDQLAAADAAPSTSADEFAVRQTMYEGVRRLLAQASDGITMVDPSARQDVQAAVDQASDIAGAFADAADEAAAQDALQAEFGTEGAKQPPAAVTWIKDTCGVDIDD